MIITQATLQDMDGVFAILRANHVSNVPEEEKKNGFVTTKTNHNGGINGGITNGMPVQFQIVIKPTPSIYKKQETIDVAKKENVTLQIEGRHDPAIIHRARVVVDAVTALVLADLLTIRFGTVF